MRTIERKQYDEAYRAFRHLWRGASYMCDGEFAATKYVFDEAVNKLFGGGVKIVGEGIMGMSNTIRLNQIKIKSEDLASFAEQLLIVAGKFVEIHGLKIMNPVIKSNGGFDCERLEKAAFAALNILAGEVEETEKGKWMGVVK